jgi:biotin transport system substrate-specific component
MFSTLTYSQYFSREILKVNTKLQQIIYDLVVSILGSILLSLSSKISFVLPFTFVPVTMQTFAVLFLSMIFGRKSFYIVVFYIIEGVFGLPVFSRGLGVLYLLGPTGGYILGFLVASYVCGLLAEYGFSKNYIKTFFAMIFGNLIIYFFGIVGLLRFVNFDFKKAIIIGVLPFILGDLIKIFVASLVITSGWKILKNKI